MAVGRRIPIRGSIRLLSPIEGKFRVKGSAAQMGGSLSYFWTGMRLKATKAGIYRPTDRFPPVWDFFRLAERFRIPTMSPHKSSVFLAELTHPEPADLRTAPDDPV